MDSDYKNILFSQETAPIVLGILEKYGLSQHENDIEILDPNIPKDEQTTLPVENAVVKAAMDVILGNVLEKDLASVLQNQLSVTPTVAQPMAQDIKEKLIAIGKKVSPQEWEEGRAKETVFSYEDLYEDPSQKVRFVLPENTTFDKTVDQILQENNLQEDDEEFLEKDSQDIEPRAMIVEGAATAIAEKKLPENKITELLQKHLEISLEVAQNIISGIRQKLIPFAQEKTAQKSEGFREKLLEKLRAGTNISQPESIEKEPIIAYPKKPDTTDVEENAKNMDLKGKNTLTKDMNKFPENTLPPPPQQNKKPDTYQEPIE